VFQPEVVLQSEGIAKAASTKGKKREGKDWSAGGHAKGTLFHFERGVQGGVGSAGVAEGLMGMREVLGGEGFIAGSHRGQRKTARIGVIANG